MKKCFFWREKKQTNKSLATIKTTGYGKVLRDQCSNSAVT